MVLYRWFFWGSFEFDICHIIILEDCCLLHAAHGTPGWVLRNHSSGPWISRVKPHRPEFHEKILQFLLRCWVLSSYEKVAILSRWDSRWIWKLLFIRNVTRSNTFKQPSNSHQPWSAAAKTPRSCRVFAPIWMTLKSESSAFHATFD